MFVIYRAAKAWTILGIYFIFPLGWRCGCGGYPLVNNIAWLNLAISNLKFHIYFIIQKRKADFILFLDGLIYCPLKCSLDQKAKERKI